MGTKTKEHVIPQWLMEMTGDPKRAITLGLNWRQEGMGFHTFAFDQFTAPACYNCNQDFSRLEENAKRLVARVCDGDVQLSAEEWVVLLDWLDKVRIGTWLAMLYLNANPMGIRPRFHISSRIGMSDRMVAIYLPKEPVRRFQVVGADSPVFWHLPSCFLLAINGTCFFNIATSFLFSPRLGFPQLVKCVVRTNGLPDIAIVTEGTGRIRRPLIRKQMVAPSVLVYQPIFTGCNSGPAARYYDTGYVRDQCLDWDNGKGKVFIEVEGRVSICHERPTAEELNVRSYDYDRLLLPLACQVYDFQNYLVDRTLETHSFEDGMLSEREIRKQLILMKRYNDAIISLIRKSV